MDGEGFGQGLISGLTRSFGTCCHTLHAHVAAHVQGSLPADWLVFAGWELNPLDRDERFQLVLTIILLSCSPDATTLRNWSVNFPQHKHRRRSHHKAARLPASASVVRKSRNL
jgi:hypothetical protein